MQIVVELYAAARQLAGATQLTLNLSKEADAGATVADVRAALTEQLAELAPLIACSRLAVNGALAVDSASLVANDRVALILPVSGG